MTNITQPTTPEKSSLRLLLKHPIKGPGLIVVVLLSLVTVKYIDDWLWPYFKDHVVAFVLAILFWVFVAAVSIAASIFVFNAFVADKSHADHKAAEAKWEDSLSQLRQAARAVQEESKAMRDEHINTLSAAKATIQQELKALGDERLAFYAERERIRRSLEEQERQFYDMVEAEHDWLYNHEQILRLEAEADWEILVIAPDFFYEARPDYEDVIVQNLLKATAPTYKYFVPVSTQNKGALQALYERLVSGLERKSCQDPNGRVRSRFEVRLIPEDPFPHCVAYGLALYRFKDPTKNRCLIYWPKEIGSWNLDILAAGKQGDGPKIVNAITSYIRDVLSKYPVHTYPVG